MTTDDQANLQQTITSLKKLNGVLAAEQEILKTPGLNGLDVILVEKQELLELISAKEESLMPVLQQVTSDKNVAELSDLLNECRRRNEENNVLTRQGMKNIDRSINFLRSVTQAETSTTYDTAGKTGGGVDKRNLGLA